MTRHHPRHCSPTIHHQPCARAGSALSPPRLIGISAAPLALSLGLLGCAGDAGDAVDAGERSLTPPLYQVAGRYYVLRDDGIKTPLLRPEEMAMPADLRVQAVDHAPAFRDAPPPSHDLSAYQTPVKDQLDRGTCGSFATVGAIEAAYRRTWGLTLDLSEQYMFHVIKSTTVDFPAPHNYENQSSYWWGGGWPQTTYMLPTESDAPYAGIHQCPPENPSCRTLASIPGSAGLEPDRWPTGTVPVTQQQVDSFEYSPLHIPANARNNARYGVASFTTYSGRDTAKFESLIASNQEVIVSMALHWRQLPSGVYDYDDDPARIVDGHVMLLVGYNRAEGWFLAKNSWGADWNGNGYAKLSYRFLQNAGLEAASIGSVVNPYLVPQAKAKWMGVWQQDHDGWPGTLVIRRLTNVFNTPTRFGTYYLYGDYSQGHSANGYSIDGNHGIRFLVASETVNAPGTLTGNPFEVDQYDAEPTQAAGTVGAPATGQGGVHLGRSSLPMPYSNTFTTAEWIGTWDLDSNGARSVLTITAVTATAGDSVVTATISFAGATRPISGTVERASPGTIHLTLDGEEFTTTLRYHFWEDKLASGSITRAGYPSSGAHAVRR